MKAIELRCRLLACLLAHLFARSSACLLVCLLACSSARLLARVFARKAEPWLARRVGASKARSLLSEAWDRCAGRTGTWMRSVAQLAEVDPAELAACAGRSPVYLVLNRARRGDDVDVGHALVTAAGHGLGIDLRFRAAFLVLLIDLLDPRLLCMRMRCRTACIHTTYRLYALYA